MAPDPEGEKTKKLRNRKMREKTKNYHKCTGTRYKQSQATIRYPVPECTVQKRENQDCKGEYKMVKNGAKKKCPV
jgi:hypothetical protein